MRGYVQIYTGDGKGKTTASLGLCVRMVGAGGKVLLVQFMKKGDFSEIKGLGYFGDKVQVAQFGSGRFVRGRPLPEDIKRAKDALGYALESMKSGQYDLVILDEVNVAMNMGLLDVEEVQKFLEMRPENVEVVLTGRDAPMEIMDAADLVTECKMIKHYYKKGVMAREGIEK